MPVVPGTVWKGGLHLDNIRLNPYFHADKSEPALKLVNAGIGTLHLSSWDAFPCSPSNCQPLTGTQPPGLLAARGTQGLPRRGPPLGQRGARAPPSPHVRRLRPRLCGL